MTPPLYSRRKRQRERTEAEASGSSFWTSSFSEQVRVKILYAAREAAGLNQNVAFEYSRYLILKDEGRRFLIQGNYNPVADFLEFVELGPDQEMPGVVEAIYASLLRYPTGGTLGPGVFVPLNFEDFETQTREILEEERVAFDFSNGQMVAFESKELFQAILEPAIQLLHDARFKNAETAYQHALEEVSKGRAGDAITDASTALQELLVALGCTGNSLGPLIKSARSRGLIAAHDERMVKAITAVFDWVSADRAATGDAHKADSAAKADAWFMIHVVGALMVRLASGPRS